MTADVARTNDWTKAWLEWNWKRRHRLWDDEIAAAAGGGCRTFQASVPPVCLSVSLSISLNVCLSVSVCLVSSSFDVMTCTCDVTLRHTWRLSCHRYLSPSPPLLALLSPAKLQCPLCVSAAQAVLIDRSRDQRAPTQRCSVIADLINAERTERTCDIKHQL